MGSTYERGVDNSEVSEAAHLRNLASLEALHPAAAAHMREQADHGQLRGWAGVRCGVHDRLPMTGRVPNAPEGLYMNAAMGSRGLTLGLLCGELLAAQWHGEPLPIEARLAKFLDATRFKPKS